MKTENPALPKVVTRDKWLVARNKLLAKEKAATRSRDALNAERRRLPMVRIEKDYVLDGPDGKAGLLDFASGARATRANEVSRACRCARWLIWSAKNEQPSQNRSSCA